MIPSELLQHCFQFLPVEIKQRASVLCRLSTVSRLWRKAAQGGILTDGHGAWARACAEQWKDKTGQVVNLLRIAAPLRDLVNFMGLYRLMYRVPRSDDTMAFVKGIGANDVEMLHEQDDPGRCFDVIWRGSELGGDRAIRSNRPFPSLCNSSQPLPVVTLRARQDQCRCLSEVSLSMVSYFEVEIGEGARALGNVGSCSIGLCTQSFPLYGSQPGWNQESYGYNGDDGRRYTQGIGTQYGECFGVGDTIGCGIDYLNKTIFFTKNGEPLDAFACEVFDKPLYPTVGIDTHHPIHLNLGDHRSFVFDLAGYEARAAGDVSYSGLVARALTMSSIVECEGEVPRADYAVQHSCRQGGLAVARDAKSTRGRGAARAGSAGGVGSGDGRGDDERCWKKRK